MFCSSVHIFDNKGLREGENMAEAVYLSVWVIGVLVLTGMILWGLGQLVARDSTAYDKQYTWVDQNYKEALREHDV